MLSGFISVALLSGCALAQMNALSNVTTAFSMAQIVPDVVDSFNPVDLLNITFTDSVTMAMVNVDPGALLTMEQTADEPMFILDTSTDPNADSSMNSTFVVLMVDPDAPTPQMPNVSEFLHFLGGDFTADITTGLLSNSSPALMEFFSPAPPPGSDPHRYVLLVFSQPDDFDTNAPMFVNSTTPRTNFSASAFAQEANLGTPIAGNYFLVGPADNSSSPTSTSSTTSDNGFTPTDTSIPTPSGSLLPLPNPTPSAATTASAGTLSSASAPPAASTASATSHGLSIKMYRDPATVGMGVAALTAMMVYLV